MQEVILKRGLGEAVKARAAEKGIPISSLEKKSGYSSGMISRWCTAGDEDYSALSKLVTMSNLLDISLDELVGRQGGTSHKEIPGGPVFQLLSETGSGQLTWLPWQEADDFPANVLMPTCDNGRLCSGGYWTQRDKLKFVLVCFCDDIQDKDEPVELSLYCTPEHRLPLCPVLPSSDSELSQLYTQILLSAAFAPAKEARASEVRPKTIPFRAQSR